MTPWESGPPECFDELFQFYNDYVKPLYSSVQTQNVLPNETLWELNAALDHISRHWVYAETEAAVVSKAYSHLKRACLDIFKIKVQDARRQYDELRSIDTSIIDNGEFDRKLIRLFAEIKQSSTEARRLEGAPDADESVPSFSRWEQVFIKCEALEADFYLHPALDWAKRKSLVRSWGELAVAFLLGLLTNIAWEWLQMSYPILRWPE
jgi:hypothetical protein